MKSLFSYLLLLTFVSLAHGFKPVKQIRNVDIQGSVKFSSDTIYVLDGMVFVEPGEILTIEAGTVIKSKETIEPLSALVVARGGKIYAEGTSCEPIVFTALSDNIQYSHEKSNLSKSSKGLWGGIALLGTAPGNFNNGTGHLEGFNPERYPFAVYGGNSPDDNSGIMRYVSIRHAGAPSDPNSNMNGLTLAAVGRQTVIDHIESFSCSDDGFEWYGGTVHCTHLVSAFCGDDAFDWDDGFMGTGQFWLALSDQNDISGGSDKCAEMDGGAYGTENGLFSDPTVCNVTFLGFSNKPVLSYKESTRGTFINSLFGGEGTVNPDESMAHVYDHGDEVVTASIDHALWWGYNSAVRGVGLTLVNAINANPNIAALSREPNYGFDPRPLPGSPALTHYRTAPAGFQQVSYCGAFGSAADPENLWISNWTKLYNDNFIPRLMIGPGTRNCLNTPSQIYLTKGQRFDFGVVLKSSNTDINTGASSVFRNRENVTDAFFLYSGIPISVVNGNLYMIKNVTAFFSPAPYKYDFTISFVLNNGAAYRNAVNIFGDE